MNRFALGFWTCAVLYAAIGVAGVLLIGAGPGIAFSSDGYGTHGALAAKQTAVRPWRSLAPTPLDASGGR